MEAEWEELTLEDSMGAVIDYRGKTPRKTPSGIPLITAKIVKGGRIETPDEFIAEEDYVDWMRRGVPECGDVVVTMEAPLGEVAQLGNERVALAQRLICLRAKPGVLNNNFLKFLMQSNGVQEQLRSRATGTTVLGIKQSELRKVILPRPPLPEQRAIAHILGTLDDKIELNRRMNETLEEMARALFKSWFVDFDAVRAKMDGRWRPGKSLPGLPAEHYDLFPDRLVPSELGEIPEGWEVRTLGDVGRHRRLGVKPSEITEGTPYIALEHMPKRCIALSEWDAADGLASGKFRFQRGDILFGKLRPYFHKVGVAPLDGVCSTDIVVIAPVSEGWFGFLLSHVSSQEFVYYTDASSTGTKMPRTSWPDMARYQIVLPNLVVTEAFTKAIRPAIDRILATTHESHCLAALRDTLLPKLVSGEIRMIDSKWLESK